MKKITFIVLILVLMLAMALPVFADPPSCNWGQLTSDSIADGFDQGGHSSDPSGDGLGPEPRVGLANVVNQGDMNATCELIDSLLP
jgi:hypothetical protein